MRTVNHSVTVLSQQEVEAAVQAAAENNGHPDSDSTAVYLKAKVSPDGKVTEVTAEVVTQAETGDAGPTTTDNTTTTTVVGSTT